MKKSTMVSLVGAVVSLGALAVGTYLNSKDTEGSYATLDETREDFDMAEIEGQVDLYDLEEEIEA